jgi:hypothetical protein
LLRYHRPVQPLPDLPAGHWNGALVLDVDHDGRSDLFLVGARQTPRLLRECKHLGDDSGSLWFTVQTVEAPPLRQAIAVDLDLDGWTDVVGLSEAGLPVFLHNKVGRLADESEALGGGWPRDLIGLAIGDLNGDGWPEVLTLSQTKGLQMREDREGVNHVLCLKLACTTPQSRGSPLRASADGFGTRVMVHAGTHYTEQEWTTLTAGLGQSLQPLLLGLGRASQADVVRLRWPDGVRQAESDLRSGRCVRVQWMQRRNAW